MRSSRCWDGRHDVRYFAHDPLGNVLAEGSATLDANGGFDLAFELPAGSSTGTGFLFLALDADPMSGASQTHTFQIAEFRRPEFEVAARTESEGPYVRATPLTLAVDATYYAGGPLAERPRHLAGHHVLGQLLAPGMGRLLVRSLDAVVVRDRRVPGAVLRRARHRDRRRHLHRHDRRRRFAVRGRGGRRPR